VTTALILGFVFGIGLVLVVSSLVPAPLPLDRALADLGRKRATTPQPSSIARIFGTPWMDSGVGRKISERNASDLRITGTSPAEHLAARLLVGATAMLWAPFTAAIMWIGGVHIGMSLPLWCSIALAPLGFTYPAVALRSKASERRRTFRHGLSAFLDIVSISLAGGRGVESALHDGADAGHGWVFEEIRQALLEARLLGETPWAAMARLGTDLGVPELGELAASASLAGSEGARVRASLAAKAKAIRLRGLADIESAAQSASERMSLPIVALMVGFIVFLAYPAVDRVLTGI
jgi:Flp pilus assembly protein TadB